ncbi:MAG: glycosyltransferase family 4 protein, partial [Actinomycetota bacterium]
MAVIDQLFFRVIDRGGESVAAALEDALEARGHEVDCLGFFRDRDDAAPVTADWTILAPTQHSARAAGSAMVALARRFRRRRPDVVAAHTQVSSLLGLTLAWLFRVPRRISIHHQPHKRDLGWPFWVSDAVAGTLGIYTDVILVSHLSRDAVARFPARYRRRVRLVPNEVPMPALPDRAAARATLGLEPDDVVFCFLGAVEARKGAAVAARAVAASGRGVLLLAGRPGDESDDVATIGAATGGRIRPLGHLTRDEVAGVLAASDALVFPTRAENRSLTLLEGLSAGLAVIASDIRGNRDVLAPGEGSLVD